MNFLKNKQVPKIIIEKGEQSNAEMEELPQKGKALILLGGDGSFKNGGVFSMGTQIARAL